MENRRMNGVSKVTVAILTLLLTGLSLYGQKSSFQFKGLKRTFLTYIPDSYPETAGLPLLIALHGKGGNGRSMILLTKKGFNSLSEKEGFIIVYPDGIEKNWNDGRIDDETDDRAHRENLDDVGFISALIDYMSSRYRIDTRRVYVTGISNGAMMAYRLACELSHKITAIAPVDGNIPQLIFHACYPSHPVSVLAVNNVDDPLVPFDGGEIYGHFRRVRLGRVLSTEESIRFWVKRNGCMETPVTVPVPDRDPDDGTKVTRTRFINPQDGTEVLLYTVEGGGHTWPGGFQYLPVKMIGRTSRDFIATEVIWDFFKQHAR